MIKVWALHPFDASLSLITSIKSFKYFKNKMRNFFKMIYYDWTICHVGASRDALLLKCFNIYNLKYVMHGVSM